MAPAQYSWRHILTGCIFCNLENERTVEESKHYFVIRDLFPVSYLHTLVIPKRHVETYFDLNAKEFSELPHILRRQRNFIQKIDPKVTGFNIGNNSGTDAGQTIPHCHIHLIPRRKGDVFDPSGGVRGVIPTKQKY